MRAEDVVDILEADAEREQLAPPALLAGKVERRRMALVLAGAGVDQHGVPRRAHHESLVGHHHLAGRGVEDLRLHRRQMPLEGRPVESRERSEEHTSELQSLMRISYAVFCLKKKPYNYSLSH